MKQDVALGAIIEYAFITRMRQMEFIDRELDIMVKDSPVKLLDLPVL